MKLTPDCIFESSWEVCNKVGGIFTVLSTRAKTLQDRLGDKLIFIGPDCWGEKESPYFAEDKRLMTSWKKQAASEGLNVKIGRWIVPGNPIAILVDFNPFFADKERIYGELWNDYKVDSLHAYGDYDEASMFSYAAGRVVESYYKFYKLENQRVIYHANEWMCGLGALYINKVLPAVGTIFTTHATSIGRSICGNQKPLYAYLDAYNGDQMAGELNMQSKHSIEKQTALHVDCFSTVSDITAIECEQLLDKKCDVVLPNGFEGDFVPKAKEFNSKRKVARTKLLSIANALTGKKYEDDNTLIVSTSGRYEFRNKGIDLFLNMLNKLRFDSKLSKEVLAFIEVPGWMFAPRLDLQERLAENKTFDTPLIFPQLTHWLHEPQNDNVLNTCAWLDLQNRVGDKVTVIFIPCYLDGQDGILNLAYYDAILANDLCVYPSYYEPWGYTPLEAVAFKTPCVTTDLAGFGLWANSVLGKQAQIQDGVATIHRDDNNFEQVSEEIKNIIVEYSNLSDEEVKAARENASKISKKAYWKHFIKHYDEAYDIALRKAESRKN